MLLAGAVLAAVHHAEVVALRVGEPFGSLVLAVAVTVIEVALIVTLMVTGDSARPQSLARDTVFAAVMITCNGILGLCLLVATVKPARRGLQRRGHRRGAGHRGHARDAEPRAATFTTSRTGPEFSPGAARLRRARLARPLRAVRGRPDRPAPGLLPAGDRTRRAASRRSTPTRRPGGPRWLSLGLLLVALVAVVGDAKAVSPTIESGVERAGFPPSFVGVVIALLVLLPETLAAVRAARRDRVQTSLNLALGSAMASIGLTIPAIAIAIDLAGRPAGARAGRDPDRAARLTVVVGVLTVVPGRATLLQGGVHLVLFAAFIALAINP